MAARPADDMRRFLAAWVGGDGPTWRAWCAGVAAGVTAVAVGCGGDTDEDTRGVGGSALGGASAGGTGGGAAASGVGGLGLGGSTGGAMTLYGIPYEFDCSDGINNDPSMDSDVDCADSDCASSPSCVAPPPYGIPMEYEFDCSDGINNDPSMDSDVDCADSDCVSDPSCSGYLYAAPM